MAEKVITITLMDDHVRVDRSPMTERETVDAMFGYIEAVAEDLNSDSLSVAKILAMALGQMQD